jgi:hypothetical protein
MNILKSIKSYLYKVAGFTEAPAAVVPVKSPRPKKKYYPKKAKQPVQTAVVEVPKVNEEVATKPKYNGRKRRSRKKAVVKD